MEKRRFGLRVITALIHFYSRRFVYRGRKFLIGHYFAFFLKKFMLTFFYGFLIKPYRLYCFTKSYLIHCCLIFLKNHLLLQLIILSDLCVVDNPEHTNYRFSLTYVLLSLVFSYRFFLRICVSVFVPVLSVNKFYASAL